MATLLLTLGLLLGLVSGVLGKPAYAHELRPTIADVSYSDGLLSVTLRVNIEAVLADIGIEHDDTEESPNAQMYNTLRALPADALKDRFNQQQDTWLSRIDAQDQAGDAIDLGVASVEIPEVGDVRVIRDSTVSLAGELPTNTTSVTWQWATENGPLIIRSGRADDEQAFSQYLDAGQRSDAITLSQPVARGMLATVADYLKIGYIHILPKGLDHILFVVGLFLLTTQWRALLWQVTGFTLAHTVTLALGIFGLLNVPPTIVEPLIALSIAIVCIENLFSKQLGRWRTALVFFFGLLHGLGFASVLGDIGLPTSQLVVSLLAFNVGVELGQLTVIAACLLFVWPIREQPWYRSRVTIPLSILIGVIGLVWFFQRIPLGASL